MSSPYIIFFVLLAMACAERQPAADTTTKVESFADTLEVTPAAPEPKTALQEEERQHVRDTTVKLLFPELRVKIFPLEIFDRDSVPGRVQSDTVYIDLDLAYDLEGKHILIDSDSLTEIKVEFRYETSLTVMNEGPHCDLIDWKHYRSEWEVVAQNDSGAYVVPKYNEKDHKKFPQVSNEEIRKAINEHCGEEWVDRAYIVTVSHNYIRISGVNRRNGNKVKKLLIFNLPMGC